MNLTCQGWGILCVLLTKMPTGIGKGEVRWASWLVNTLTCIILCSIQCILSIISHLFNWDTVLTADKKPPGKGEVPCASRLG